MTGRTRITERTRMTKRTMTGHMLGCRNDLSVLGAVHSRDPCVRGPAEGKEKWLLGRRSQVFLVPSS